MTFEERIDRLTERHEALTEGAELLYRDVVGLRATVMDLVTAVQQDAENIRRLAHIAGDATA